MLVTFKFKNNDILYCDDVDELDYKIENDNLAIYKENKLLGYFESVIGIDLEVFLDKVKGYIIGIF